jgi:hypothetical protein
MLKVSLELSWMNTHLKMSLFRSSAGAIYKLPRLASSVAVRHNSSAGSKGGLGSKEPKGGLSSKDSGDLTPSAIGFPAVDGELPPEDISRNVDYASSFVYLTVEKAANE